MVQRYALVSQWHLTAPIDRVWSALYEVGEWPRWWPYVKAVEEIEKGEPSGIGAVRLYTWGSRLPYNLSFTMRVTVVERPRRLEGVAEGALEGVGRWQLAAEDDTTWVRYDWQVVTKRAWMVAMAPVLAPVFRWNHGQVMSAGARGLAKYLGVNLLAG